MPSESDRFAQIGPALRTDSRLVAAALGDEGRDVVAAGQAADGGGGRGHARHGVVAGAEAGRRAGLRYRIFHTP